jgi:hypothetical protein
MNYTFKKFTRFVFKLYILTFGRSKNSNDLQSRVQKVRYVHLPGVSMRFTKLKNHFYLLKIYLITVVGLKFTNSRDFMRIREFLSVLHELHRFVIIFYKKNIWRYNLLSSYETTLNEFFCIIFVTAFI